MLNTFLRWIKMINKSDYQFRIICKVLDIKDVNKIRINKRYIKQVLSMDRTNAKNECKQLKA
jgi:hypothetical protein